MRHTKTYDVTFRVKIRYDDAYETVPDESSDSEIFDACAEKLDSWLLYIKGDKKEYAPLIMED